MATPLRFLLWALLIGLTTASAADAQGIFDRARDAARRGAERAVEREAERRANEAVTNAIECALGDTACADEAREQGRDVVYVDADGNPVEPAANPAGAAGAAAGNAETLRPGEGVWANYDFIPGERPLFVDDFAADRVGNFPQRLEFAAGNAEVVEWQGQRLLRVTAQSAFYVPLPETLPERFTVEFDAYSPEGDWIALYTAMIEDGPLNYSNHPGSYPIVERHQVSLEGEGPEVHTSTDALTEGLTSYRISVDGSYLKMYAGEHRVLNVPNATIVRGDKLHLIFWYAKPDQPTYIGNLRVMAGGRELYDALSADGSVATQGVLFDTGSARIRPESTPTLEEIAAMLQQHGDLRLRIEGHTDGTGNAATNQTLSEQRAQAVRDWLVQAKGIAADRLEAVGKGQTEPVADDGTAEGRQANRRVVLVRL